MVVKTAISLPEDLFSELEARAAERGMSRSRLLADALRAYLRELETEEMRRGFEAAYGPAEEPLADEETERMIAAARRGRRAFTEAEGPYEADAR